MKSKSNSFNCIIEGKRCTKCCEAIHLPIGAARKIQKGRLSESDIVIKKYWRRISKRIAKKVNPYMFSKAWTNQQKKWLRQEVDFFKCLALKNGVCTVYEDRPTACKDFTGDGLYKYECAIEYYENNLKEKLDK